jgi:hypothetical protein
MNHILYIGFIFFLVACSDSVWPPTSMPIDPKITQLPRLKTELNGSSRVFENEQMTKSHRGMPWGMLMIQGNVELPYNLFAITATSSIGYTANQFEIVSFDDQHTSIRIDKTKNDRLLLVRSQGPISTAAMALSYTETLPGTRVRYKSRTFLLNKDGWYENGKKIHSF